MRGHSHRSPLATVGIGAETPGSLRSAITEELERLVAGEKPELLPWVREYGVSGARLIPRPPEIWTEREDRPGLTLTQLGQTMALRALDDALRRALFHPPTPASARSADGVR